MRKLLFSFLAFCQMSFLAFSQVTFSVNTTSGCAPLTVNFTTTSTSGNYYEWEYVGGQPKEYVKNPTHIFYNPGFYNVRLSVYDTTGGGMAFIGNAYQTINVNGSGLYTNTDAVCPGQELDIYVMPYGNNYNWNFGDGNTSTQSNPNHSYSSPGTYTITVSVNTGGCGTQNLSHTISVQPNTLPTSEFYFRDPSCPNEQIDFNADDYKLQNYTWDFGDGANSSGTDRPTHTYTAVGNYVAVLTVTSSCGTSSTTNHTVHIQSGLAVDPSTKINVSTSTVCPNDNIDFDFYPYGGNSFAWNFGDGTSSNLQRPSHSYTAAGVYTASLTITNGCGNNATFTKTISVSAGLPYSGPVYANSNASSSCPNSPIFFDAPTAYSYLWNFGDGTTSTSQSPVHTYTSVNTYTVSLLLSNGCGNSATATNTIVVSNTVVPTLSNNNWGTPSANGCAGDSLVFYSYGAASYLWSFGDGVTTTQTQTLAINNGNGTMVIDIVKHAYSANGTYKVKLKYFNSCGNSAIDSMNVTIGNGNPVDGGIAPMGSTFDDCHPIEFLALGGVSYQWNFGDGTNLTTAQTQVSHSYTVAGSYTASVLVTNGCGNTATYYQPITVQSCSVTGVRENNANVNGINIYPNPFENKAVLEITLVENSKMIIEVLDINGQKVMQVANEEFTKGKHNITVDASELANGVYFIKTNTSKEVKTIKVVVMK